MDCYKLKTKWSKAKKLYCPVLLSSFNPLEEFEILGNEKQKLFPLNFPSFNEAVDVYFSRLEAQKSSQKQVNCELEAERKLAAIAAEQQSRISGLQVAVEAYRVKGQAVTERAEDVEAALKVARAAIESGMDWTQFARSIEAEKKSANTKRAAVASLFVGLKLENGQISLKLDADVLVDLMIGLSAHANATRLYDLRTQARLKMERTLMALESAMKSASAKIRSEMLQSRQLGRVRQLQALRKPFWFEKFAWFISSDGFLVLAGRDAQQNEVLVKKYLRAGDVYVHADVHGAGSLIVKNHVYPKLKTPPPKTLHEAGTFSICFSRAWEAKIVTSAWWVRAEQVSKTAPSGEYLGTGSFMIRGQKNFLPPMQLSLSFGFLFVLDEEERKAKMMERKRREEEGDLASSASGGDTESTYEKYRIENVSVSDIDIKSSDSDSIIVNTANIGDNPVSKTQKSMKNLKLSDKTTTDKSTTITQTPTQTTNPNSADQKKSVRGKHGKEKKIKKKYADQDEEERSMRLEILASAGKKSLVSVPVSNPVDRKETTLKIKKEPKPQKTTVPNTENIIPVEDEEESVEFIAVDYFTFTPEEEKQYLFVIPVCFPTSALSPARFRIKLVPGNLKKGKAVKSVLSLLTNVSSCPMQQWRDLMKAVPENEMITVMPSKVALGVSVHETKKLSVKKKPQKKPKN